MPISYSVAENILGTMGTVCWCGQLLPQIWKSWRTKSTKGLSHWLPLLWAIAAVPLGVYSIVQDLNIPLIVQPQLFSFLSLISWVQCLYYEKRFSRRTCFLILIGMMCIEAALQTGIVYALRPPYQAGKESARQGVMFFGILSAVLISLALIPQYYEIYKYKAVIGISIAFMTVDALGGVFSDLSLAFKPDFDVLACCTYTAAAVLDGVVIICAIILNPRARRREKASQAALPESKANPDSAQSNGNNVPPRMDTVSLDDVETQGRAIRRLGVGGFGLDIE